MGGDRHGLHEPQPVGPRRPRVRLRREPSAAQPDHRRRPLARSRGRRPDRRLGPGRLRRPRAPAAPAGPLRGQHARRSRSPKATRSRPRSASVSGSTVTASATSSPRSMRRPTPTSTGSSTSTTRATTWRHRCGATVTRRPALRDAARIEVGLRTFLEAAGSEPSRTRSRTSAPGPAAGDRRPAPHGRRLRLRRRGRLEDGAARSGDEGHGDRPAGRDVVHGGLHLPPGPDRPQVLGAHMLEVCPSIADGRPSCEIHPLVDRRHGRTRSGSSSPPARARQSSSASSISATGSGSSSTRSRWSGRPRTCRACPVARALWEPRPGLEGRGRGLAARRRSASHRPSAPP